MKHTINRHILFILLPILLVNCNSVDTSEESFSSSNGIISIETEHYDSSLNWKSRNYYTGVGVTQDFKDEVPENFLDYTLNISEAGTYYVHYLGNSSRNAEEYENVFKISLLSKSRLLIDSAECIFPESNAPLWSSHELKNDKNRVKLSVKSKGKYFLRLSTIKGDGFYIDKIVLSNDADFLPSGMGPVQTRGPIEERADRNDVVLPPSWAFGVLYGGYTDHWQTLEVIDSLIGGDFPIDAYWIDSYFWDFNKGNGPKGYIDFVGDTAAFPDVKKLWDQFEKRKIKAGIWVWNLIQKDGNETAFDEFLEGGYFNNTYINTNGWHNETENTLTGSINFENPEAVGYWKKKLKPFFDNGLDFLKLDNSSDIPFCKAAFEATQEMGKETKGRGFILAHVHSTYDYRHKLYPTKWTGDAKITWSQPDYPNLWAYAMGGLKENIQMVADPARSTYEVPFLSHDAGGYNYFGSTDQSEELYMRWIQFSSMNSIMMFFSTADNPTRNHPYRYSASVQDNFRKYTHLRIKLFPYIYTYALETHLTGEKMIRGMQGDGLQYLLGDEILLAPVFEKGARQRTINLPAGEWIDPETMEVFEGDRQIVMEAPLEKLPMLIRKGSIIPKRNYARSIEMGNNDTLTLEIYPSDKKTTFSLLEDDGISNEYLEGKYAKTVFSVKEENGKTNFVIEPIEGSFKGMKDKRYYRLKFHSSSASANMKINGVISEELKYLNGEQLTEISFEHSKDERVEVSILK